MCKQSKKLENKFTRANQASVMQKKVERFSIRQPDIALQGPITEGSIVTLWLPFAFTGRGRGEEETLNRKFVHFFLLFFHCLYLSEPNEEITSSP